LTKKNTESEKNMNVCLAVFSFLVTVFITPVEASARESTILTFIPAILAHPIPKPDVGAMYVSPNGGRTDCSVSNPCSLTMARDRVRSLNSAHGMSTDITVYLRNGIYTLNGTFALTPADSGTNGHTVHYKAYPGENPVISGGTTVTGWSLYDTNQGIYRAWTGGGIEFRQLYVNGKRAIRARGADNPHGFQQDVAGFTDIDPAMQGWSNQQDIEIVGFNEWRSFRCPVAGISGTTMSLQNPCWSNSSGAYQPDDGFTKVSWIENSYELLDEPGEWYLDHHSGYLYYKPAPNENPDLEEFIYPRLQSLVSFHGTDQAQIKNISFSGITFTHATWLTPSSATGYGDLQAGFHFVGTGGTLEKTPAAVEVTHASSITFAGNTFVHLGGAGLTIAEASTNIHIIGNRFEDISSSGIQLGDINPNLISTHSIIRNNVIIGIGREYHDGVGIFAGYVQGAIIEHNELRDLPYSGISIGWGWGMDSPAGDNIIRTNWIENFMHTLHDGGGIYTLSPQPGSEINANYICRQPHSHGAIYPDEGTSGYLIHNNVMSHIGDSWLFIHNGNNNTAADNFTDNGYFVDQGLGNSIGNTTIVQAGNWPQEALTIMQDAGVSAGYSGSGQPSFCRPGARLLFVEDDADPEKSWSRNGYDGALFALNIPYDIWDTGNGDTEPDLAVLNRYQTIIWSMGYADIGAANLTAAGESALENWLDTTADVTLLFSSHMYHAWPLASPLMKDYLGINSIGGYTATTDIEGVGLLADFGQASLYPPVSRGDSIYSLNPGSAATILQMNGLPVGTTGNGNNYQATYLAFPPAAMEPLSKRTELLERILSW
jgi:hypothetical protein